MTARPAPDHPSLAPPAGTVTCLSRWLGPLGRIVKARVLSGFTRQQLKPLVSVAKRQDLLTLADLLATGQVTPVIGPHLPPRRSSRRPPLRRGRPHPREGRRHRLTT
jgi:hypothetical protein